MRHHGFRPACYIEGEGFVTDPDFLGNVGNGCPVGHGTPANAPGCSRFRFGRMFTKPRGMPRKRERIGGEDQSAMLAGLIALGKSMNISGVNGNQPGNQFPDSNIPAGYTYLGQLIAHEITFDNTKGFPVGEPDPEDLRSPTIDLDSLYGPNPPDEESRNYYDPNKPACLRIGTTFPNGLEPLENDLFRDPVSGKAFIGDERNDENLAVAQLNVALIKFHNKVVERLETEGHSGDDLFALARSEVIRHFQWIVLYDYLPKIVRQETLDAVRKEVQQNRVDWLKARQLFMPLEFSAAAFRFGHSMVRNDYQWNLFHSTQLGGMSSGAALSQLFDQTKFSGTLGPTSGPNIKTEWVIDWRRFFDFSKLRYPAVAALNNGPVINLAKRIDTNFDLHLDTITNFPHKHIPKEQRSLTVRNLLRGFALGLPTGEEMASAMGIDPIDADVIAAGPHRELLSSPLFHRKTPAWYYVLKEAELGDGQLGEVGGRIVAQTLIGIIKKSPYSILNSPGWFPQFTIRGVPKTASAQFEMIDLIHFADTVNSLEHMKRTAPIG